jgi:Glycosyl hydrolase family 115
MSLITKNTVIYSEQKEKAICLALANLKRDMSKKLLDSTQSGIDIRLEKENQIEKECYVLENKENTLFIKANSTLGFIYGIYEVSRRFIGIQNFWFWMDQKVKQQKEILVPDDYYQVSNPFQVKLRGWFVNDEVLIDQWSIDRDNQKPWEMVFEALLRCQGNMVIPGTDKNSKKYRNLASDMGLAITHHHAEPLGAEMFARAYPDLEASYSINSELFQKLWKEGIEEQKEFQVVWNLGFRGQGDRPFWLDDPRYQTDESRGQLMSELIKIQYELVKKQNKDAICCTNLYGETMELYQKGLLHLPEDVIHIWADNGFGKMVSRRQENHNPRIPALPKPDSKGRHGIYYHASFYDLQAANHITMLPNSIDFVKNELKNVLSHGAKDYWIINCSNVKPHVFFLDLISNLWTNGTINEQVWLENFVLQYFGSNGAKQVEKCYEEFSSHAVVYGPNEDDHAGEQFANHIPRMLMTQFMKNRNEIAIDLKWATSEATLAGQVNWYEALSTKACASYHEYLEQCDEAASQLSVPAKTLFQDSLQLQVQILYYCYTGALYACKSINKGLLEDYQKAFYFAGKSKDSFEKANQCMRDREHGVWTDFYKNECLADVKQSAWVADMLMGYLRTLGDGPHFWEWQREFLHAEEDRRVVLVLNMENHLTNGELYHLLKEKWEDKEEELL